MTSNYYQYWPFPIGEEEERKFPDHAELIDFFTGIYSDGFKVYWQLPGESLYGAKAETRSGEIIQRSFTKSRWEINLSEELRPRLTAFVDDFRTAGIALRDWLNGQSVNDIIEDIKENLILLAGLKNSYTIYELEDRQYWPFQFSEEEKRIPQVSEKISFLESIYSEGFEVYRVCEDDKRERYFAKSQSRLGFIVQWEDRKSKEIFWEFGVSENDQKGLTAFLTDFKIAGAALREWLNGRSVNDTFENIKEYLTISSGSKESYTIYEDKAKS
jgi:hypothetical protein